jgi:hypothetical protein
MNVSGFSAAQWSSTGGAVNVVRAAPIFPAIIPAAAVQPLHKDLAGPRLRYRTVEPRAARTARSALLTPITRALTSALRDARAHAHEHAHSVDYQQMLRRQRDWIDLNGVHPADLSATQILQKVCTHRKLLDETDAALTARLRDDADEAIDEAALLAFDLNEPADVIATGMPMTDIRARFASALIHEWHDAAIGCRVLPSAPFAPVNARYWYDGNAIRNAHGKTVDDIVNDIFNARIIKGEAPAMQALINHENQARRLFGQPNDMRVSDLAILAAAMGAAPGPAPDYAPRPGTVRVGDVWLTREELRAIVVGAMRKLLLDTCYPGGTPLHSVATILLRRGPIYGIDATACPDADAVMHAFNRLAIAWDELPRFPLSPHLYAAYHLARDSGVLLINTTSTRTPAEQISDQVTIALAPGIAALDELPDPALRADIRSTTEAGRQACFATLSTSLESIAYTDATDLQRQLSNYFNQRLLALAPLPTYDLDFLIENRLREKFHFDDAQLRAERSVHLPRNDFTSRIRSVPPVSVTPLNEFKQRAANHMYPMRFGDVSIDTEDELNDIKQAIGQMLFTHPIIEAKATEILRERDLPVDAESVRAVRALIVREMVTIPQSRWWPAFDFADSTLLGQPIRSFLYTLKCGDTKAILRLLPFIIPIYEMEEGLRLQDRQRAWDGLKDLGVDILFTAVGMGLEKMIFGGIGKSAAMKLARANPSIAERAGIDAMRGAAGILRDVPGSEWIGKATLANTEPKSLGADRLRWSHDATRHSLYLIDEQRSVSVRAIDGGFRELDRRGRLIPNAPVIFGDALTGRGYRITSHVGMQGGVGGVSTRVLQVRSTVSNVLRFWKTLSLSPQLAIRRATPRDILKTLFVPAGESLETHANQDSFITNWRNAYTRYKSFAQFEDFWLHVYRQSDTAAAIINQAYEKRRFRGTGEVTFNGERSFVNGNDICFLSDKHLAELHYVSSIGETAFQQKRMFIHEGLHWLTRLGDPELSEAHMHRGPVIYLTDRILSEVGDSPSVPARISYKTPPRFSTNEIAHQAWAADLDVLHDWSVAEDRLLDKILNAGRQYPDSMMVMGQNIGERVTVRQGLALHEKLASVERFGARDVGPLYQNIAHAFNLPDTLYKAWLRRLLSESSTFREIAAAWHDMPKLRRVAVLLSDFGENPDVFFEDAVPYQLSRNLININRRKLYYFSDAGVTELLALRQFTGAMLDFFVSELVPRQRSLALQTGYSERGIVVSLENEVAVQIGYGGPERICESLAGSHQGLLQHQTDVRRAANSENGYLHRKTHDGQAYADAKGSADILGLAGAVDADTRL